MDAALPSFRESSEQNQVPVRRVRAAIRALVWLMLGSGVLSVGLAVAYADGTLAVAGGVGLVLAGLLKGAVDALGPAADPSRAQPTRTDTAPSTQSLLGVTFVEIAKQPRARLGLALMAGALAAMTAIFAVGLVQLAEPEPNPHVLWMLGALLGVGFAILTCGYVLWYRAATSWKAGSSGG